MAARRICLMLDADARPTTCARCRARVGWVVVSPNVSLMVDRVPEPDRFPGLDALQVRPHRCAGRAAPPATGRATRSAP